MSVYTSFIRGGNKHHSDPFIISADHITPPVWSLLSILHSYIPQVTINMTWSSDISHFQTKLSFYFYILFSKTQVS